jgi:peptide/nickel transport system ATP-binding protein
MVNKAAEKKVLLRVQNLKQYFPVKKASMFQAEQLYVRANEDITLDIYEGETFGLVGESGCGKSTLGRTLLQLNDQTDGRTLYYGRDIYDLAPAYVLNTLEKLEAKRKALVELRANEERTKKEYEKLPEGDEKYKALEKYRNAEKKARTLFLDMVELIGGFMAAENLSEISNILVKHYKANVEASDLRLKLKLEQLKSNDKTTANIKDIENKITKIEKDIEGIQTEIDKLRLKYKDHPDYAKYESYKHNGINLAELTEEEMRVLRKDLQLIFQDPYSSLNPRLTVGQIISEGLYAHRMFAKNDKSIQEYILDTMNKCGLAPYFLHRYPHQFSGGQRQRIGIARSVALSPKFIVCDEAVSALDVSIQSQIINLLLDLKEKEDLTYLFISHDLSVIKYISDRVGVMYLGNIVELAETEELYTRPMHPYTEALLSAIPTTDVDNDREIEILEGDIPSPIKPPNGCKFHTRCKYATEICEKVTPVFEEARLGHFVACHHKLNTED